MSMVKSSASSCQSLPKLIIASKRPTIALNLTRVPGGATSLSRSSCRDRLFPRLVGGPLRSSLKDRRVRWTGVRCVRLLGLDHRRWRNVMSERDWPTDRDWAGYEEKG